jgi:hypothetical protein
MQGNTLDQKDTPSQMSGGEGVSLKDLNLFLKDLNFLVIRLQIQSSVRSFFPFLSGLPFFLSSKRSEKSSYGQKTAKVQCSTKDPPAPPPPHPLTQNSFSIPARGFQFDVIVKHEAEAWISTPDVGMSCLRLLFCLQK